MFDFIFQWEVKQPQPDFILIICPITNWTIDCPEIQHVGIWLLRSHAMKWEKNKCKTDKSWMSVVLVYALVGLLVITIRYGLSKLTFIPWRVALMFPLLRPTLLIWSRYCGPLSCLFSPYFPTPFWLPPTFLFTFSAPCWLTSGSCISQPSSN